MNKTITSIEQKHKDLVKYLKFLMNRKVLLVDKLDLLYGISKADTQFLSTKELERLYTKMLAKS